MKSFALALTLLALLSGPAQADPVSNSMAYPLSTCIVSGEKLGAMGDPVIQMVGEREIRLCCNNCVATFNDDQATWLAKIDAKLIEQQSANYPTVNCVVSNAKYTGMGEPVDHLVGNRLLRLCCENCVEKVDADPAAFVAKLDAAVVSAQGADYAATTCPISGGKLGGMGDPVELVFNGELVKLCCSGCIDKFYANPNKALATLHGAEAKDVEHGEHAEDHSGHKH